MASEKGAFVLDRLSPPASHFPTDMWSPVQVPYMTKSPNSPKPPSVAEIKACRNVMQCAAHTVVEVSPRVMVKYGQATLEREGQALIFIERHAPRVPAPRLYAMFRDEGELFLVMQRMPGVRLDQVWADLDNEAKSNITAELRTIFDDIRLLKCPWPDFFGAADGGPVPYFLFYTPDADNSISGPFADEDRFHSGLVGQYAKNQNKNGYPGFKSVFYESHFCEVLRGHKVAFAHGDVQRKNIMVQVKSGPGEPEAFRIALVDWEDSGWYPEYWDYFVAYTSFQWDDDWCQRIEEFLPAWPKETAMMKMMYSDLFF